MNSSKDPKDPSDLRKKSRFDLIDIISALQEQALEKEKAHESELEELRQANAALQASLDDRTLQMTQTGSIAEASLRLNHVFEDAQAAADQYLISAKAAAQKQADDEAKAAELLQQTQQQCDAMLADATAKTEAKWQEFRGKVLQVTQGMPELWQSLPEALKQKLTQGS